MLWLKGCRSLREEFDYVRLCINCKYDVCSPRGLSGLSGKQFPPTLCGRVGEAVPLLLNKRLNCNQELFLVSLPGYQLHMYRCAFIPRNTE